MIITIFYFQKKNFNTENKILIEYFNFAPSYISFSYFAEILSKKYKANIYFYHHDKISIIRKLKNLIKDIFGLSNLKIAQSIGCRKIIDPKIISNNQSKKIFLNILKKIKKNDDILKIKIFNVPVGDLIYDEYLVRYNKGTINIEDEIFIEFLEYSVCLFLYWYKYLDQDVKSLILSHTSYFIGLPGRIAAFKKIPCYHVSNSFAFYLTKNDHYSYTNYHLFPKIFKKIPKNISSSFLKISKKEILKLF